MGTEEKQQMLPATSSQGRTGLMSAESLDNFGAAPSEGSCRRNWRKKKADGTKGISLVRLGAS